MTGAHPSDSITSPDELPRRAVPKTLDADLASWSPAACGLAVAPGRPEASPGPAVERTAAMAVANLVAERGAVVPPEQVILYAGLEQARRALLLAVAGSADGMLAPAPWQALPRPWTPSTEPFATFPLRYDGRWRVDLKALRGAVTDRTRALLVASPAHPTGACPTPVERAAMAQLCSERGLVLVGDEALLDSVFDPVATVLTESGAVAAHVSGMATVTGWEDGPAWIACAGPARTLAPLLARLHADRDRFTAPSPAALAALPAALGARAPFLAAVRQRVVSNRSRLELAALREAPWSVLESGGGWAAIVQLGGALEAERVSADLLEMGVAIRSGSAHGLPDRGQLVLSLLAPPLQFDLALERLERRLREWRG